MTIKGVFITVLAWLFLQAGLQIESDQIRIFMEVCAGIAQLIGIALAYIGRWRHGDITLLGKKRTPNA